MTERETVKVGRDGRDRDEELETGANRKHGSMMRWKDAARDSNWRRKRDSEG